MMKEVVTSKFDHYWKVNWMTVIMVRKRQNPRNEKTWSNILQQQHNHLQREVAVNETVSVVGIAS